MMLHFNKDQFISFRSAVSNLYMNYQHTFYLFDFRFIVEHITITVADIAIYWLEFFKIALVTKPAILQNKLCKLPTAPQTTLL